MTRRHAPERHYLVFERWPLHDQSTWEALTAPGATLLDDAGAFARLRPRTNAKRQQTYSHWLNHIQLTRPDLLPAAPPTRLSPETVAAWLAMLQRTVAPYTRLLRAVDLLVIARALQPAGDWVFLARAVQALQASAVPARNKEPRIRSSAILLRFGLEMMRAAEAPAQRPPALAAIFYRDGLMIALLALRPLRLRNFTGLELGRTLRHEPGGWRIAIPGTETKTHRAIDVPWPADLLGALERYLACHRPILARDTAQAALWVGAAGQALASHTIRQAIIGRTRAGLGVPINPHLFRDCAATTLAIEDPAHIGAASTILGHASSRTTHKHYIQATTLSASGRHQAAVAARRKQLSVIGPVPVRSGARSPAGPRLGQRELFAGQPRRPGGQLP